MNERINAVGLEIRVYVECRNFGATGVANGIKYCVLYVDGAFGGRGTDPRAGATSAILGFGAVATERFWAGVGAQ